MTAGRDTVESRQLHRSEERFRLLVSNVVDYAIFALDPTGVVESWNVGAERLKGYTAEEIIGRHYSTFYTDEQRSQDLPKTLLREARAHGRVTHTGWRVRKDGTRFWADVVITALHDADGRFTGFAKVTRDRTAAHMMELEREAALEEKQRTVGRLEDLERWRREFTSSIVHDLQTPVTVITGFSTLLADGVRDPADAQMLEQIRSSARSLQDLIDNLRAHVRLAEPTVAIDRETVALRGFVDQLVARLAPILAGHSVEVEVADVRVEVDPPAFERILGNLLTNAARHTPEGTRIHVDGRRDGGGIVCTVADDGDGIPPDLLDRVFERSKSGERRGTGLGLSIVRQYVELHGGTISVANLEGAGACFRFVIPDCLTDP